MKKTFVLCVLFLFISVLFASALSNTMTFKEEIGYNNYNYTGKYSNNNNHFNVNTISSNTILENRISIMFNRGFGASLIGGVGYQKDVYCFNRFASIPSNLNAKAEAGVVFAPMQELSLALSCGFRTTFLLSKSNWISQFGGGFLIEYLFDIGLSVIVSSSYWYNTNYRSIICGVGLGYVFGGER